MVARDVLDLARQQQLAGAFLDEDVATQLDLLDVEADGSHVVGVLLGQRAPQRGGAAQVVHVDHRGHQYRAGARGCHVQTGHQAADRLAAVLQQGGVGRFLVGRLHAQLRRLLGAACREQGGHEGQCECALHCETTFMLTAR
ncbi:MAG: hypothetical protein BGO66_13110 [Alicycliphilus sp. 69-12]|nr:MAG: hypothetical protein BGO66_13110 [Alicycliphilus sp. 69-12]